MVLFRAVDLQWGYTFCTHNSRKQAGQEGDKADNGGGGALHVQDYDGGTFL